MESALRPDLPGLAQAPTPALVVDQVALDKNISRMAEFSRRLGVGLRPHAKTHKAAFIARKQVDAGALGVGCATIFEAAALSAEGIGGVLVTSPVVGAEKVALLARLNRTQPLSMVVDHPAHVEQILSALHPNDPPLSMLVDVDIGHGRTGVAGGQDGVALARLIAGNPRLKFQGLQGYAGHIQHIFDPEERRAAAAQSGNILRAMASAVRAAGLECSTISGSGTGAHEYDVQGPYTELQVGSYVFMDADYGRVRRADGSRLPFAPALFVLATVVSANKEGQITVDAGTKALAANGPPPDHFLGLPEGAVYTFGGDEHGIIRLPAGAKPPALGAKVLLGATHCDPTVNLHAAYLVVDGNGAVTTAPVLGRYGGGA